MQEVRKSTEIEYGHIEKRKSLIKIKSTSGGLSRCKNATYRLKNKTSSV